jgi:hypothetical protein
MRSGWAMRSRSDAQCVLFRLQKHMNLPTTLFTRERRCGGRGSMTRSWTFSAIALISTDSQKTNWSAIRSLGKGAVAARGARGPRCRLGSSAWTRKSRYVEHCLRSSLQLASKMQAGTPRLQGPARRRSAPFVIFIISSVLVFPRLSPRLTQPGTDE